MNPESEYAVKETRKSKLPLIEQDKAIAEQSELVNILVDRLEAVLTPYPDSPDKDHGDRVSPVQSQMATEISNNNDRIRRNSNKISNLLERLEV